MLISLGADEGSRHELHSPNEVEPRQMELAQAAAVRVLVVLPVQ